MPGLAINKAKLKRPPPPPPPPEPVAAAPGAAPPEFDAESQEKANVLVAFLADAMAYLVSAAQAFIEVQIEAQKAREASAAQKALLVELSAGLGVLEVDVAALRAALADAAALAKPVAAADVAAPLATCDAAEAAQGALTAAKALGAEHALTVSPAALEAAVAKASAAEVPEEALAPLLAYAATAREQQASHPTLVDLRARTSDADPMKIGVAPLRAALAAAAAEGIPEAALAQFVAKMGVAEAAQAESTILDVIKAISEPSTMLSVNTAQVPPDCA